MPPATDLAGALHEVSNALTVIVGWIEEARAEGGTTSGALDFAVSRARQARNIVRRAIGARVPPDPPRAVWSIVHDAVLGLGPEARRSGVRLATNVDASVRDREVFQGSSVEQILTNLILNAIAFSTKGAEVRV